MRRAGSSSPPRTGRSTDERAQIETSLAAVEELDHVAVVSNPLEGGGEAVSEDGRTGFATVVYDVQQTELEKEDGEEFEDAARQGEGDGLQVEASGELIDLAAQQDAPVGELVGVAIAILLLTLLFRSLAAMFVTLVGALVGVIISQMILAAVAKPLGIPDFASPTRRDARSRSRNRLLALDHQPGP